MSDSPIARLKKSLRRVVRSVEEEAKGEEPVATAPSDAPSGRLGGDRRETSTNAQMEGAADEPWSGNR